LTSCPINTPFAISKHEKCINCTDGYFNLGTQKCERCPAGQEFNVHIRRCDEIVCELHQFLNKTTKKCETCPVHFPVFNRTTEKCEECPKGKFFNDLSR